MVEIHLMSPPAFHERSPRSGMFRLQRGSPLIILKLFPVLYDSGFIVGTTMQTFMLNCMSAIFLFRFWLLVKFSNNTLDSINVVTLR